MKTYYTAEEAMRKLELPRSTFHYLVRKGEIPKLTLPLRKQAVYPRAEIDRIVQERKRMLEEINTMPERLAFVVPTHEELEQLLEIERACYHEETIIPISSIEERLKYNPENIHVLKDAANNRVEGSITMSPVKPEVLQKLLSLEIDETQVKPSDYLPFAPGKNDCYVVSIIARPSITEKFFASRLLTAIVGYLTELLEKGVEIQHLYTVATTHEGEQLAKDLGFTSMNSNWTGDYEDFRHSYVLDLDNIDSSSPIIRRYLKKKSVLERRRKRHAKENNDAMSAKK